MLAIVSAMAGTMLCNAPGVRREASLTILFTTHKMDSVYTAAASLGFRTRSRVMRRTWVTSNNKVSWWWWLCEVRMLSHDNAVTISPVIQDNLILTMATRCKLSRVGMLWHMTMCDTVTMCDATLMMWRHNNVTTCVDNTSHIVDC